MIRIGKGYRLDRRGKLIKVAIPRDASHKRALAKGGNRSKVRVVRRGA